MVYGCNTVELRKTLWTSLRQLASQTNEPWLIWGNFNAILQSPDKLCRVAVTIAETKDFDDFIQNLMLNEML